MDLVVQIIPQFQRHVDARLTDKFRKSFTAARIGNPVTFAVHHQQRRREFASARKTNIDRVQSCFSKPQTGAVMDQGIIDIRLNDIRVTRNG